MANIVDPTTLSRYIGTKVINAKPMTRGEYNEYRGWEIPPDEEPTDPGYLVVYSDGYESWSPHQQFIDAYRRTDDLNFGLALEAMKKGYKVARKGWNGPNMFIWIQEGSTINRDQCRNVTLEDIADNSHDKTVTLLPHIDMKAADGRIVIGWLASQTDMLSDDWFIVE